MSYYSFAQRQQRLLQELRDRSLKRQGPTVASLEAVFRAQTARITGNLTRRIGRMAKRRRRAEEVMAQADAVTVVTIRGNAASTTPTTREYRVTEVTHDERRCD